MLLAYCLARFEELAARRATSTLSSPVRAFCAALCHARQIFFACFLSRIFRGAKDAPARASFGIEDRKCAEPERFARLTMGYLAFGGLFRRSAGGLFRITLAKK